MTPQVFFVVHDFNTLPCAPVWNGNNNNANIIHSDNKNAKILVLFLSSPSLDIGNAMLCTTRTHEEEDDPFLPLTTTSTIDTSTSTTTYTNTTTGTKRLRRVTAPPLLLSKTRSTESLCKAQIKQEDGAARFARKLQPWEAQDKEQRRQHKQLLQQQILLKTTQEVQPRQILLADFMLLPSSPPPSSPSLSPATTTSLLAASIVPASLLSHGMTTAATTTTATSPTLTNIATAMTDSTRPLPNLFSDDVVVLTPKESLFCLQQQPHPLQRKSYSHENRSLKPNPLVVGLKSEHKTSNPLQGQVTICLVSVHGMELGKQMKSMLSFLYPLASTAEIMQTLSPFNVACFHLKFNDTSCGKQLRLKVTVRYLASNCHDSDVNASTKSKEVYEECFYSDPFIVFSNTDSNKKRDTTTATTTTKTTAPLKTKHNSAKATPMDTRE